MFSRASRLALALALVFATSSAGSRLTLDPVIAHRISMRAVPLVSPQVKTAPGVRLVGGWALTSDDPDFGGLSALLSDGRNFTAVSDAGLFVRFVLEPDGKIPLASVAPLRFNVA